VNTHHNYQIKSATFRHRPAPRFPPRRDTPGGRSGARPAPGRPEPERRTTKSARPEDAPSRGAAGEDVEGATAAPLRDGVQGVEGPETFRCTAQTRRAVATMAPGAPFAASVSCSPRSRP